MKPWIAGIIVSVGMALAGVAWAGHENRIERLELASGHDADVQRGGFERLAAVEAKVDTIIRQNEEILRMLERAMR